MPLLLYTRILQIALVSTCLFWLCACQAPTGKAHTQPAVTNPSALNQGYSLLYDLLGDEKNVSKLLWIKRNTPELGKLIKEISSTASEAHKGLDAFAKTDRNLNLKEEPLPTVEKQTREAIAKSTGKQLLGDKGKELEVHLLLTQVEALNYASHLAEVLARSESEAARQQFLRKLSADLGRLHDQVLTWITGSYTAGAKSP